MKVFGEKKFVNVKELKCYTFTFFLLNCNIHVDTKLVTSLHLIQSIEDFSSIYSKIKNKCKKTMNQKIKTKMNEKRLFTLLA